MSRSSRRVGLALRIRDSLRAKVLVAIACALIAASLVLYGVLRPMWLSGLAQLERESVRDNALRARNAVDRSLAVLAAFADDWGAWDDTYDFMATRRPAYVKANITDGTMRALSVNALVYLGANGQLVLGRGYNLEADHPDALPPDLLARITPHLRGLGRRDGALRGIVMLNRGPMLVAMRTILTSSHTGESRGVLLLGRYLDARERDALSAVTHLSIDLCSPSAALEVLPASIGQALATGDGDAVYVPDNSTVLGLAMLRGIDGAPVTVLQIRADRSVYRKGLSILSQFLIYLALAVLLLGLMVMWLMERLVLRRVEVLNRGVEELGRTAAVSVRVRAPGRDEIARLGQALNRSLEALERSQAATDQILASLPVGVVVVGTDKRIRRANAMALQMVGLSEGDSLTGHLCHEVLCPADASACPILDLGQAVDSSERWIRHADGSLRPILKTVMPMTLGGEDVLLEAMVDITEQMRAQERQAALLSGLRAIVSAADELIACRDLDSLFRRAVELCAEKFGLQRCAIYLNEHTHLRGSYGYSCDGIVVDESRTRITVDDTWRERLAQFGPGRASWLSLEYPVTRWDGDELRTVEGNWLTVTPILPQQEQQPLALLVNTGPAETPPPDEPTQETVAVFCSLLGNIAQYKGAEGRLRAHATVISAVNQATEWFLRTPQWEGHIQGVLRALAEATQAIGAHVYRNTPDGSGMELLHAWPGAQDDDLESQVHWEQMNLGRWRDRLAEGRPIHGALRDLPPDEQDFLRACGALAVAAAPVFVGQEWWGVIELQGQEAARSWSSVEVDGLVMAANALGAAIQRGRNEEALRESERSMRGILSSMDDLVVVIGLDGVLRHSYQTSHEAPTGLPVAGPVGRHVADILPVDAAEAFVQATARVAATGFPQAFDFLTETDGTPAWYNANLSPVRTGDEQFDAAIAVVRDITQRKTDEHRLEEALQELARSNTELEQFAYVASHDLQEPLRMVSSYVQLLARRYQGQLDADADEFIGYAVDGARRMQELIKDLLTYSRVDTRGKALVEVSLESALGAALDNLQVVVAESGATVTHSPLPTVLGDDLQLTQLFQNLISNATKFRGEAAPLIHISATREQQEWVVEVRDNGIGIAPQYLERIFVIFQRLHTRREYPGTGIGLAICRKIADRHGGRIWAEAAPGGGSAFRFALPIRSARARPSDEAQRPGPDAVALPVGGAGGATQ
jgi:PAS domain S-box-containing protein